MRRRDKYLIWIWAICLALLLPVGAAFAACGDIIADAGGFGPYDYRDPSILSHRLPLVENVHFTPDIENLSETRNTRILAQNIQYTLRKFPNHHRALDAVSRLAVREGSPQPEGLVYPVECWFQRAVVFQTRDGMVRMLYGLHLSRLERHEEAVEHMNAGLRLNPDNPMIQYQLGLLYLEVGNHEEAARLGREADAAGYPVGDLKQRLEQAGYWE